MDPSLFRDCPNLRSLNLSGNRFATFDLPKMSLAKTLEDLDVSQNMLTSIYITEELYSMIADDNQISSVTVDASPAYNLELLSLSNNRISDISPIARLTNLESLNISRNDLQHFELGRLINALDELEALNISHCKVSSIDAQGLTTHESMMELDISNNELAMLDFDMIKNFPDVETVVLGGNRFNNLDFDRLLDTLKDIELVGLQGTEWDCTSLDRAANIFEDNNVGFWRNGATESCPGGSVSGICCK